MRAVTIRDASPVVASVADPEPGAGEILVRVRAAGLNGADILQVAGHYPAPPGSPADIPGLELAGEVVAPGAGAERFRPGDRVMAVVGGGAQAELAVVHERAAIPAPDGLPWPEAGGFPEVFTTAHDALFTQCGLQMGERVLVSGAAGGVGTAGVQLASEAGATVVASARNPEHHTSLRALGAASAVLPEEVATAGPFDVILELVGAPSFPANLEVLGTGGRLVVIGVGGGARIELDLRKLMTRRAKILASTLRARPLEQKADAARRVERAVLPALGAGRIRVPVAATYPLEEAAAAYERFRRGGKLGKIVLEIG